MHTMIIMFVGCFLIQYFLMSPIMVNKCIYITNNLGKVYMAVIMSLFMVILEIMMHDHHYNVFSLKSYTIISISLLLFIYLYRTQKGINDRQYLEGMIEHHSMGIFTSEEIVKKTNDYNVAKLAKNIIQTQKDEIRIMEELLKKK